MVKKMCLKVPSFAPEFLTFLWMISFFLLKLLDFATMQMTILNSSDKSANIGYQQTQTSFCDNIRMVLWYMVFNANKCHFLTLGFNEPFQNFSFNDNAIKNFTEEKILRILNDDKLNIKSHCVKGCNFTQFPGVETLRQGSSRTCISTKYIWSCNKHFFKEFLPTK